MISDPVEPAGKFGVMVWDFEICANAFKYRDAPFAQVALEIFTCAAGENSAAGETEGVNRAFSFDVVRTDTAIHFSEGGAFG